MSFEAIINDQRAISRLTVAINSVIAQLIFDGRAHKPWIYDDTQRMLGVAWNLDLASLAPTQQSGDHYGLVSETQAPANPKLEALSKIISDQLETIEEKPAKRKAAA
jgi:hypothetical protein